AMATAMRERRQLHNQYRIVRPDGSIGHVESVGAVVADSSDGGVRLVGIDRDVTERVAAEQREDFLQRELRDAARQAGMAAVAMQQRYAKLGGVDEVIDIRRLVEESMRINASAFERHAVKVVCEFAEVRQITVDKHKVLQILVNLLRNAKDACESVGEQERRVTIGIERCAAGVRVVIADNGSGIAAEHMNRIFTHGFTTKKTGHGFGLHSGALAAKEIGG